jgi:VRR-NUC domain protein
MNVGKNSEGYPDPTASQAINHTNHKDYSEFKTYDDLIRYTMACNPRLKTRYEADKYIRDKMPKESYFQKKIIKWIKKNIPQAVVWKEAAGAYSRQGIPDITCIVGGRYYGFEVKRPFIGVLSKIQEQTINELRKAGAVAEVVTSEKEVEKILLHAIKEVKDAYKIKSKESR